MHAGVCIFLAVPYSACSHSLTNSRVLRTGVFSWTAFEKDSHRVLGSVLDGLCSLSHHPILTDYVALWLRETPDFGTEFVDFSFFVCLRSHLVAFIGIFRDVRFHPTNSGHGAPLRLLTSRMWKNHEERGGSEKRNTLANLGVVRKPATLNRFRLGFFFGCGFLLLVGLSSCGFELGFLFGLLVGIPWGAAGRIKRTKPANVGKPWQLPLRLGQIFEFAKVSPLSPLRPRALADLRISQICEIRK